MHVKKHVLLALTSAALFVAAPISAKCSIDPVDAVVQPVASAALEYALRIEAEAGRLGIFGGVAGMPAVLAVGFVETWIMLPGDAVLRLDPVAVLPLKKFDFDGECHIRFEQQPLPVEMVEVFFQVVSMADGEKFCSSELMWLRTDLAAHWEFQPRN